MRIPSVLTMFALFAALFAGGPALADEFVVPFNAALYMKPMGGSAGAVTEFGLGTTPENALPIFKGLPSFADPPDEVLVGYVRAGIVLHFYQRTDWEGTIYWAFSNANDDASRIAFQDIDNSLGMNGSIIENTGKNTWLLHLDDAASVAYDDDDNDILIQIRLVRFKSEPRR